MYNRTSEKWHKLFGLKNIFVEQILKRFEANKFNEEDFEDDRIRRLRNVVRANLEFFSQGDPRISGRAGELRGIADFIFFILDRDSAYRNIFFQMLKQINENVEYRENDNYRYKFELVKIYKDICPTCGGKIPEEMFKEVGS